MANATKTRKTTAKKSNQQDTVYNLIMATGNFNEEAGKAMAAMVKAIGQKTDRTAQEQAIATWFAGLVNAQQQQDTVYNLIMATGNFNEEAGKAMAQKVREIGAKTDRTAQEQAIAVWFAGLAAKAA